MQAASGAPKFDQQDWSQFDFSRWHLDGLTLDADCAAFTGLSEQLFNSEEWRQHFQGMLPALQSQALVFFKDHSRQLSDQKDAAAQDFDKRIDAARQQRDDFQKSVEAAFASPVVEANPKTFHLVAKVAAEGARLGLPGVMVQIMDPRNQTTPLAQALTDLDGNAVLTVPEEVAKALDKQDAALEILSPAGKTFVTIPGGVCMRLSQVETKVIALPDSEDTEPHKNAALKLRLEREAHGSVLAARIDALIQERETRLHDLDRLLADNEAIVAELEAKGGTS